MYEELIRRLREEPLNSNKAALPIMDLCIDAAAAIENLSHRLDMAQGERDAVTRHMIELEQEVSRLQKEVNAATEDIRKMLTGECGCICEFCTNDENPKALCMKEMGWGGWCCKNASWRGPQKEA